MLNRFKIAETCLFSDKLKEAPYCSIAVKIRDYVYPQLQINPFFGPNIKKLKGEFKETYRYRIGPFRLFYIVEKERIIVIMADVAQRKDSYK
ncbi:MAG: type II toxin-antitoxin system mRNA interferase toxin, RelE/StbE family [Fibrobacterota bacterium]